MSTKYILHKHLLGAHPEIELEEAEYELLKRSKAALNGALSLEERYEQLVLSFVEWENAILSQSVSNMVRFSPDQRTFLETRLVLNLKLTSFLTMAKVYVKQSPIHVKEVLPTVTSKDLVKPLLSAQYDSSKEYRFMEALRNYAQHRGVPIHWYSYGSRWTELGDDGMMEFTMDLRSEKSSLAEDEEFKKSVLDEMPDRVDLKVAVRSYLESLSEVQGEIREKIEPTVTESRLAIEAARTRYTEVDESGCLTGLAISKFEGDKAVDTIPLNLNWDEMREDLIRKNRRLVNLKRRTVASLSSDRKNR